MHTLSADEDDEAADEAGAADEAVEGPAVEGSAVDGLASGAAPAPAPAGTATGAPSTAEPSTAGPSTAGTATGAPAALAAPPRARFASFAVNGGTCAGWDGERVVVWRRGLRRFWAVQEACPHAAISLAASDIEDLSDAFADGTRGPCISCPAHAYVFDLGTGACLTHPRTKDARRYRVGLWRRRRLRQRAGDGDGDDGDEAGAAAAAGEGGGSDEEVLVWLSKAPMPPEARDGRQVDRATGNAIQMEMVRRALEAKFGPP